MPIRYSPFLFLNVLGPLKTAFSIIGRYWWVVAPFLLFAAALESWLFYVRQRYLLSVKWVLLEVKPPPDVQKSPKIAENIFSGLHGVYAKPINWRKKLLKGEVQKWFSFEIVGTGGDIHFYIRVPEDLRNLVESQVFAQYPDAEIKVADDYIADLPQYIPNEEYDLFGTELIFTKEDAYPIKTYPFFEEESGKDEFKRTDPLAPLAEVMSSLQPGEHIWLQLVMRPTGGDWAKEGQKAVDKIIGKEPKVERDLAGKIFDVIDETIFGAGAPAEEKKKEESSLQKLTPGQKFVLDQVENKIAKLGFKTGYRFIYLARKDNFHMSHVSSVIGVFKQTYSNNLNTFKPNGDTITSGSGWFPWLTLSGDGFFKDQDEFKRKWSIYQDYRKRNFVRQVIILNTEELATLWHLPGIGVKAPSFPRVEAKKGQPPVGLPTR